MNSAQNLSKTIGACASLSDDEIADMQRRQAPLMMTTIDRILCALWMHKWDTRELHVTEPVVTGALVVRMTIIERCCRCGESRIPPSGGSMKTRTGLIVPTQFMPLATVEARYKDLLQRLGVQGHDGAVAEIGKLRKAHGLEG